MPGWFSPYPQGSVVKLLARLHGMQEVGAWLPPCLRQQRRNHMIIKVALSGFFYARTVFARPQVMKLSCWRVCMAAKDRLLHSPAQKQPVARVVEAQTRRGPGLLPVARKSLRWYFSPVCLLSAMVHAPRLQKIICLSVSHHPILIGGAGCNKMENKKASS